MEVYIMKAFIDRDGCISCGLCPETCPEVFRMDDEGIAEVYVDEVPSPVEGTAKEAEEGCPVSVITTE
jgi:ferredoxin